MTNFIFKSPRRLVKNSPTTGEILDKLLVIQTELRHARSDHREMSLKLEKLLIDKHLQMQVDNYFDKDEDDSNNIPDSTYVEKQDDISSRN